MQLRHARAPGAGRAALQLHQEEVPEVRLHEHHGERGPLRAARGPEQLRPEYHRVLRGAHGRRALVVPWHGPEDPRPVEALPRLAAHITLPYEGERYSIVYYNLATQDSRLPDEAARFLRRELGLSSAFVGDYTNRKIQSSCRKRKRKSDG
ncbi:MAG: hypothetical protein EBV73_03495 [Rhodocyclales bacterium]|nr:hypothetical protein [Rhodocyclales bacterium]